MPKDTYSTYEAKARFSELLRKAREGRPVTITYRGEPVAELRAVEKATGFEARIRGLTDRGAVLPAGDRQVPLDPNVLSPVARKPGALERFLRDRD